MINIEKYKMRSFVKGLWLMTSAFFFAIPIWTIRRSFIKLFLRKIGSGCFLCGMSDLLIHLIFLLVAM